MRFVAGRNGIGPVAFTKTAKVGVAFVLICVCTVGVGSSRHRPLWGSVWQSESVTGRLAVPVSAETVMKPGAPRLTDATAKAPTLARRTIPSLDAVATSATMSGAGVAEARRKNVLTPEVMGAGAVFVQAKLSWTSVRAKGDVGVNAKTKL